MKILKVDNFRLVKKVFDKKRCCVKHSKQKQLFKDVFEKRQNTIKASEYPRVLPNSISAKDEKFSTTGGGYLRYFQEDIEKMKNMSKEEVIKFKRQLREEKSFILSKN